MELMIDKERWEEKDKWEGTGVYIRAKSPENTWESVDISLLDKPSLLEWLKSRGGDNPWAEDVVGILLGHGNLHEPKE